MLTQHIFTNAKLLISHSLAYGHQYIVFVGPQKKKPFASPSHTPPCVYKTINLRGHFYDNSFIYFFAVFVAFVVIVVFGGSGGLQIHSSHLGTSAHV